MSRRIMAIYMPRIGSEWGELAGSSLYVYRPCTYAAHDVVAGAPITVSTWSFSHDINLEKMESV